ncbi:pimeloyl-ACP methyl ester carboxylesterase [Knoellia remsis]|uniref:Pimeloyl-ACP methyl ester carboxylesterase n=1 Tax=Knoellia remsis TaxID=407159 RepID=A0A2T0UUG4_9MICO|nr:alpha/beta hydrolase [Knoellia remsis]PRY61487.1 pimeloyl-ACP methyl ester carboxylesterase [Knoellia remsis]
MSTHAAAPLLAHDDVGSGAAVVLLHAGVADRGMWAPLLPALSARRRVVAPDLRGFGDTPLVAGEYSEADDVLRLLDVLGIGQATLVGASLGGRVALEIASRHPDRVRSLALVCPAYRGLQVTDQVVIEFGEREDELLAAGDVDGAVALNVDTWVGPEADAEARADIARMQRRAFEVQLAAEALEPPPQPARVEVDATAIWIPTVVFSGAHDAPHFREAAALLASRIESSLLVELPWAGHLPSVERPQEMADLLLQHLEHGPVRPVV